MTYSPLSLSPILLAGAVFLPGMALAGGIGGSLATVTDLTGVVLVSSGERFSTAKIGFELSTGSRILTMENANATIDYDDGCQLRLDANTMVTLRKADECSLSTVESEALGRQYASIGGVQDAGAGATGGVISSSESAAVGTTAAGVASSAGLSGGVTMGALAVGGVAAVGGGYAAFTKGGGGGGDALSPGTF